jgi:CDP-L-myo-inositol myo-inositolphosphotransferase
VVSERLSGSDKAEARAGFAWAAEADRRVAGVAAAARAVRLLADEGARDISLLIGDGAALAPATSADIERLRGVATVDVRQGQGPAVALPGAWQIVRTTGKPGDGLVSRWLNRPISQRLSWLLLQLPPLRPLHVTIFNAALAALMLGVLVLGGHLGLIAGGALFHLASVLDGVDGEMARATFRTTRRGATLDSAVDMATNFAFLLGFTINMWRHQGPLMGGLGIWSIAAMLIGNFLIARRMRAGGAPLGYDLLKRSGPIRGPVDLAYWIVQTLSSRDTFAFLFMVLILVGLERVALGIFAGIAMIWFPYVLITQLPQPRPRPREVDA